MGAHKKNHADEHAVGQVDDVHSYISHDSIQGVANSVGHSKFLLLDGTRSMTGDLAMGTKKITGLGTPGDPTDAVTKGYVDGLAGGVDWQESVLDKDLTSPPGTPNPGDRYIVGTGATGSWTGHDDDIAEWKNSAWVFTETNEGMTTWVEDEDLIYTWNGAAWVKMGSTMDHGSLIGLGDDDHPQYIKADGTRAFSGDQSLGTHKITNLGNPAADQDAMTRKHFDDNHKIAPYTSNASEPAVAAGEWRVWKDTGNSKWWLIYGTDGTTGGNKKVEMS